MLAPALEIEEGPIAMLGLKGWMRGQIFFNPVDQLGNTDRLGEKWMPLNAKAGLCLGFRD